MSSMMLNSILDWWLSVFGEIEIQHQTEILNDLKIWDTKPKSLLPATWNTNEVMSLFLIPLSVFSHSMEALLNW